MIWEVAGGIVIAVLILRFWPLIIGAALLLLWFGVMAALAYGVWWGVSSGAFGSFFLAHPIECVGAGTIFVAVLLALEGRDARDMSWRGVVWVHVWLIAIAVVFVVQDKPPTARKNVFEDAISAPDELFSAAPNPSDRFDAPGKAASGNKSVEHGPWEDHQRAAPQPATAAAAKMSLSLQGRIDNYTVDHYRKCWATALSMNAMTYVPRVEFRLSRAGELEGEPRLLNPSSNPVEKARGEQGLAAVRRCSPMQIPAEFTPFYDYWRVTELDMKEDMP
jgi:hypothetical protein